jgi:DNA-binding transcriptional ArsR family regulator
MTQNYDLVKICDGLAHPIRKRIYEILSEKIDVKATKLFEIIRDEFDITSRQSIFNHLIVMERAGIIELYKKKKDYYVKLKMQIEVKVKPI